MPAEVGVAYLSVVPSMKGAERTLEKQLGKTGLPAADRVGKTMGQRLNDTLGAQMDRAGAKNGSRLATAMRKAMGRDKPTEKDLGIDNLKRSVEVAEKAMAKAVEQGTAAQAAARAKAAKAQEALTAANAKQADKLAKAQAAAQEKLAAAQQKLTAATAAQEAQAAKDHERFAARRAALNTAHEAALRKVSIAQAELTDATEKYEAGSAQALKAQDKLATAQERVTALAAEQDELGKAMRSYTVDTTKAQAAQQALAKAQAEHDEVMSRTTTTSAEATKAQNDLIKAHQALSAASKEASKEQAELSTNLRDARRAMREHSIAARESADATEKSFGSKWGKRIQSAMNRAFSNPKVAAAAGVAGVVAGRAWARGFESSADSAKPGSGSMNPMAATVGKMTGLRAVADMGTTMRDVFSNMDRYAMSAATLGLKIGGLSSVALGGLGSILSMGAGLKTMGGAALALPAIFTAAQVGMYVFNTALADFANVLPDVTADYQALNGVVSDSFWERAAGPVREAAYTLLPVLRTGLARVSSEFGGWAVAISSVVSSSQGLSWIGQILENIRGAANVMGDGIGAFATGLLQLTAVGSTYLPKLGGAFNSLAYSFQDFVQKNSANGNIFRWIDNGVEQMKFFGQTIGGVVGMFGALHQASVAGGGATGFERIAAGAQAVNDALRTPLWQGALTAMFRGAYDSMGLIFDGVKAMLPSLAAFLPTLGQIMRLSGETIGAMIASLGDLLAHPAVQGGLVTFFSSVRDATTNLAPSAGLLGDAFGAIAETAGALVFAVSGTLDAALKAVAPAFLAISENTQQLIPGLSTIAQTIINGAAPGFQVLGTVIGGIIGVVSGAIGWLSQFTGLWKTVGTLAISVGAGLGVLAIAMKAVSIATGIVRGAILLLNSAMMLNPAVWIAAAIVALGVALYAAYQNIGWFKNAVNAAWAGIKVAVGAVVGWLTTVAWPVIKAGLQTVGAFFVWLWQAAVVPAFTWIRNVIAGFVSWFATVAMPWIRNAIQVMGQVFVWLWQNIVKPVWTGILIAITVAIALVRLVVQGLVWFFRNVVAPVFTWLYANVIKPVFGWIVAAAKAWWAGMQVYFNLLKWVLQHVVAPVVMWLWRNVFAPAFRNIGTVVKWAWENVIKPAFNALKQGMTWVGDRASSLRERWGATWQLIRDAARAAWAFIRDRVFAPLKQGASWVGDRFSAVRSRISDIWQNLRSRLFDGYTAIRDRALNPLRDAAKRVQTTFEGVKTGIADAWNRLKDAVKKPIKFVVDSVVNPFIGAYNKANDFWSGKDIKKLDVGFARGGVIDGYESRKRDDRLIPMRSGEGVLVPQVVRGIGARAVNTLNAAGNAGGVGAVKKLWNGGQFARGPETGGHDHGAAAGPTGGPSGGLWGAIQTAMNRSGKLYVPDKKVRGGNVAEAAKAWMGQSALDIVVGSGSPGVNAHGGSRGPWGYADTSGNLEISSSTPSNRVVGTMIHELGHILSLGHPPGGYGATGSVMSAGMAGGDWPHAVDYRMLRSVWGEPGKGVKRYSSADVEGVTASSLDPMAWIGERMDKFFDGPSKAAKDRFAGNSFVQMPLGIAGTWFEGLKNKAVGFLSELPGFIGGAVDKGKAAVKGVQSRAKVTAWMTEALRKAGQFNPGNLLSGINRAFKESSGDPSIIQQIKDVNSGGNEARGLMQVTPSTFKAHMQPGFGNILDPVHNILASINYTLSRYGSLQSGWNLPGGYALGGIVGNIGHIGGTLGRHLTPQLHDQGGLIEPGVSLIENRTGKPEQSLNPAQTQAWLKNTEIVSALARDGQGMGPQITVNVAARDGEDGSKLGSRIGERIAFSLKEVGV